jgi:hypothetical protein
LIESFAGTWEWGGMVLERRRRRLEILMNRRRRAKRKKAQGYQKVVIHERGQRKVRFIKPKSEA